MVSLHLKNAISNKVGKHDENLRKTENTMYLWVVKLTMNWNGIFVVSSKGILHGLSHAHTARPQAPGRRGT